MTSSAKDFWSRLKRNGCIDMRFDILTTFPNMFQGPFDESIIKRAREAGIVEITIHNIRDSAKDKHRTTDDAPFGGGAGMVMKPDPIFATAETALATMASSTDRQAIILLSASGRPFCQSIAEQLSRKDNVVLICGRYEGVDERVAEHLATDEIAIGDYVLSGGELAAMVVVDAVTRLLPGAVSCAESTIEESYSSGLLEYPQYTRPAEFRGWRVPEVLLSGNHAAIALWRRRMALERTLLRRPDLLSTAILDEADRQYLTAVQLASCRTPRPEDHGEANHQTPTAEGG
jgi:tRNA (guanine37-N1)-methyltransferase